MSINRRILAQTALAQSERQQFLMADAFRSTLDRYVSLFLTAPEQMPEPSTAMEQILLWKGSIQTRFKRMRLAKEDPNVAKSLAKMQRLSTLIFRTMQSPPSKDQSELWKQKLTELTSDKERIEADLMQQSELYSRSVRSLSFHEFREAIPSQGVLIDFFEFESQNVTN